ncbi:hypothetical protein N39L_15090 [Limnospira platensis NIES-39]|nr:hypothetical protein N39L_15090 [Arthrospira platensis NIES-39]
MLGSIAFHPTYKLCWVRRLGEAKRNPTNSVKCWVPLHFTQPTNYAGFVGWVKRSATQQSRVKCVVTLHWVHPTRLCDRSGFVVRRLGEAKRHPTNSVKCWVPLHFTQPTNYAGFVGWVKRSATQQIRSNVG